MPGTTAASTVRDFALVCGLSLGWPRQAPAQLPDVGFAAGVAFTEFSGQSSEVWQGTTRATAGASIALRVHGRFAVEVEAFLTQKDLVRRQAMDWVEWTDRLGALYLEVPVLVRYALPIHRSSARLFFMAGVAPAFALSCEDVATPRLLSGPGPLPGTYRYECPRLLTYPDSPDVTAVLGVAGHVHLGDLPLIVHVRFAPGVFDLAESPYKRGTHFVQWHNVTLSATLGVLRGGSH